MENITPHYVNLGILKFPDIVKLHTCLLYFDFLHDHKPSNFVIPLLSEQHSYTTRNVSSQHVYIFPFTEQTSESSLPLLLDVIFGMIFRFQSALGIPKNFLSVPFSIIIYPNTNKC